MNKEAIAFQQITFKRRWETRINGDLIDLSNLLHDSRRRLPGHGQWHRLRDSVLSAERIDEISNFLERSGNRLPVWQFNIKGVRFDRLLIRLFLDPLKNVEEL